jgi:branched-chain amino acid transport system permease protein
MAGATARWSSRVSTVPYRNEVAFLLVLLGGTVAFRLVAKEVTLGIYGLGVSSGAALALHALGVVLVFRSNRIVNFAQFSFGATAAGLFAVLVNGIPLLRMTQAVCPPCLPRITPLQLQINYWLSAVLSLALSVGLAWLVYRLVIRRFENAPRLVLTVATIFLAQALPVISVAAARFGYSAQQREDVTSSLAAVRPPYNGTFTISQGGVPVVLQAIDVLLVLAAVIATVAVSRWMRRSATGTAVRAASENPARAATLGVDVAGVTSKIWLLVGLLSGVAGLLAVNKGPAPAGFDAATLTQILLVAVIARLASLTLAAVAAVVVGVVQASVLWSFGSQDVFDGALFVLVGIALLLQRYQISRADVEQASSWQGSFEARPIPAELEGVPAVRTWRRAGVLVLVLVLVGYPFVMSPGQVQTGTLIFLYAVLALALLVLTGWAGQISLGHFGLAGVGAYAAAVSRLPFPAAVLLGTLAGSAAAVLVGIPALRLRGLHLAVTSLAFSVSVSAVLLDPDALGRYLPDELPTASVGVTISDGAPYYFFCLAVLMVVTIGVIRLRRTRTGRALVASRDNERAAQSFGVSVVRLRLSGFAVSGALAGLAGALLAYMSHGVSPQNYSPDLSLAIFLFLVIGGTGSVAGPLLGCAYAWIAYLGNVTPLFSLLLTGMGGLALLLFFPGGLARIAFDLRDAGLRRIASRNRIVAPSLMADRDLGRDPERAALLPKTNRGGGTAFVPQRYGLDDQWIIHIPDALVAPGETTTRRTAARRSKTDTFEGIPDDERVGAGSD